MSTALCELVLDPSRLGGRMRRILLVLAMLFVAGSALAQTAQPYPQPYPVAPPPMYAPPPPPVYVAPPIASDPTVRNHDGFYLRLGLGGGTLKTNGSFSPDIGVSDFSLKGGGVMFDLSIGGTVGRGF